MVSERYHGDIVYAKSPSFGFLYIDDDSFDWQDINNRQKHSLSGSPYTDVKTVNYFSDGRTLNATIWLSQPFNETKVVDGNDTINYGMLIDADDNKNSGRNGIDYKVEISGKNGKWLRVFSQWSSLGTTRTSEQDIDENTFGTNNNYVDMYADLNAIGNPEKYKVIFYAEEKSTTLWLGDFTNWIHIPRPDFYISLPTSIDIGELEKKTIEVQVTSTTGFKPTVYLYVIRDQKTANLGFNFNPPTLSLPAYGKTTSELNIEVPYGANLGTHTIDIVSNATFPDESMTLPDSQPTSRFIRLSKSMDISLPAFVQSQYLTKTVSTTLTIKSLGESILDLLKENQFIISFGFGILTGRIGVWLYDKVKSKSRNKSKIKFDSGWEQ